MRTLEMRLQQGMAVTLNLEPEQERQLQELAEAKGMSVEGYLLTLVEALVSRAGEPRRAGVLSSARLLRRAPRMETDPRAAADDAVRRMRADLLAHKEKAVEAVTRANLLRTIVEQQERLISEKELLAVTALGSREPEKGLRCYQESRIHTQNMQPVRQELEEATRIAEDLLAAFRQAETRMQSRLSPVQAAGLEALRSHFANIRLASEQMTQQIQQTAPPEQWQQQFSEWVLSRAETRGQA